MGTTSNYGIIEILLLFCIDKHLIYPSIKLKAAKILLENPIYPSLEEFFDSLFLATHMERNPENLIVLLNNKKDISHPLIVLTKDLKKKIIKELVTKIKQNFDKIREEINYHSIKTKQSKTIKSECWFLSRWPYVIENGNKTSIIKTKSKNKKKKKLEFIKESKQKKKITQIIKKSKSIKPKVMSISKTAKKNKIVFYSERNLKNMEEKHWDLGDLEKINIQFDESQDDSFKFEALNFRTIFNTMEKDTSIFKKIYKRNKINSKLWNINRMKNCLKIKMFRVDLMPNINEYSFFQSCNVEEIFKDLLIRCQNCLNSLQSLLCDYQKVIDTKCDKIQLCSSSPSKCSELESPTPPSDPTSSENLPGQQIILLNCHRFMFFQEQTWILLRTLTHLLSTMVVLLYQNPNDTFDNIKSFNLESLLGYLFGSSELDSFWALLYHTRVKSQFSKSQPTPKQLKKTIIVKIGKQVKLYIAKSEFCKSAIMTLLLSIPIKKVKVAKPIINKKHLIKSKGLPQQTNQLLIMGLQVLYLWQEKAQEKFSMSKLESKLIYNFKDLEYPLMQKIFLMIFNSKLLKIDRYEQNMRLKAMKSLYLNVLTFTSPSVAFFETEMQTLVTQIISQDLSARKYIREFENLYKKKFYNEKSGSHILQLIKNIWKLSHRHELGKVHKISQKPVEFENQLNMLLLNKRFKETRDADSIVRLPLVF
jgi:hypothetical protein